VPVGIDERRQAHVVELFQFPTNITVVHISSHPEPLVHLHKLCGPDSDFDYTAALLDFITTDGTPLYREPSEKSAFSDHSDYDSF
jgi:hypothetical protein